MRYLANVLSAESEGLWVTLVGGSLVAIDNSNTDNSNSNSSTSGGCGACQGKGTCGSGLLSQLVQKKTRLWVPLYTFKGTLPEVGSNVFVSIDDRHQLLGAFLIFGYPLLGILFGLLAGAGFYHLNPSLPIDGIALVGITAGVAVAYFLLRYVSSNALLSKKLQLSLV